MKTEQQTKNAQQKMELEQAAAKVLYQNLQDTADWFIEQTYNLPVRICPNPNNPLITKYLAIKERFATMCDIKNKLYQIAYPEELFPLFGWKAPFN